MPDTDNTPVVIEPQGPPPKIITIKEKGGRLRVKLECLLTFKKAAYRRVFKRYFAAKPEKRSPTPYRLRRWLAEAAREAWPDIRLAAARRELYETYLALERQYQYAPKPQEDEEDQEESEGESENG